MKITDGAVRLAATDLSNFLACRSLTRLDSLSARGVVKPTMQFDIGFQKLIERGEVHERRVLDGFRQAGFSVVELAEDSAAADAVAATRAAIAGGADVIPQAVLLLHGSGGSSLLGRPDFLVRPEVLGRAAPAAGCSPYEVVDAKLARTAKARAVLQCAFYSHLLAELTGAGPAHMHLALGDGQTASYRVADFAAYERRIRRYLEEFVAEDVPVTSDVEPYPEPVEHCAVCRWRVNCSSRRRADDDLSLVAGLPTTQRVALKQVGIRTRTGLATCAELPELSGVTTASLVRAQAQARLQVQSDGAAAIAYELLDPERDDAGHLVLNRGLLALPEPSAGDLFFDIEGARYYSEDGKEFGLQYLFGIVDTADLDDDGNPRYVQIWAFDRLGERRAFEELIDFITAKRTAHPDLHVYHYNHYEPTSIDHLTELHGTREEAVGRLMGRFASHEEEVDDLLRRQVFVDLYRIVRQSLQAGVESYSIKSLEPLVGYERSVALADATEGLVAFEVALEEGGVAPDAKMRDVVAGYNEDDCRATVALREWLECRRSELAQRIGSDISDLPRPVAPDPGESKVDPDLARLKAALWEDVPEEPSARTHDQNARVLVADLLEWHKREAKPGWWRYFRLREMSSLELLAEPDALGELSGGEVVGKEKRSIVRRFSFPAQEHKFGPGSGLEDPVSRVTWTVCAVDEANGTIDVKNAKPDAADPSCLVDNDGPPSTPNLEARLKGLAQRLLEEGFTDTAGDGLLLRHRPVVAGRDDALSSQADDDASTFAQGVVSGLAHSCLPIQGPPGTGKTYTAAGAILDLLAHSRSGGATRRTVGIAAPSHAVICNLLDAVVDRAKTSGLQLRMGQVTGTEERYAHPGAQLLNHRALLDGLQSGQIDIVGGTAWLWARAEFENSVDTLFIDEAGQFSLANAIAIAPAATNLVLLGDPQQLSQPSQAAQPPGAEASALGHVLDGSDTMPTDLGVFLDRTYRMHPVLCGYTSEAFYDDRLSGVGGLERQQVLTAAAGLPVAGLHFVEVDHSGNASASTEEAIVVASLVGQLLAGRTTDRFGVERAMVPNDVLVVTPFNAQVRAIDRALRAAGIADVQVGTVDKFQGREAPAVIYSMASSSAVDAPRGLEFLFDTHRLNVATSRAQALAILVASPDLLRVFCSTPAQMVLANALCRARECAREFNA